jgi:hypothetical protein
MEKDVEDLIASISLNQILIAILDEFKNIVIPTEKFFNSVNLNKDLVLDYDETGPSFVFSLRDKDEQQ